jgi:hypothetical protein
MVSTRSNTATDNTSNDNASDNNNNNNNNISNINEVTRNNNNITTGTTTNTETITATTPTETIPDETLKNSNEFYIRSHQVMGTDEQVTSVTDNLAHNPSGENLFSRLSPLPNLNTSDNLNDRDNQQSTVDNPSGENLNPRLSPLPNLNKSDNLNDEKNLQSTVVSKSKASLTEKPNDGENLTSRVSPAPTSTNTTVHETNPEQSTDVRFVSTNIDSNNEQSLTENPTDKLTVLVETNTPTKSKKKNRIHLQRKMYKQNNIQKSLQVIIKILQLNKY